MISYHEEGTLKKSCSLMDTDSKKSCSLMDTDSVVCFEGAFIELQSDSGQISVSEKGLNGGT